MDWYYMEIEMPKWCTVVLFHLKAKPPGANTHERLKKIDYRLFFGFWFLVDTCSYQKPQTKNQPISSHQPHPLTL